MQVFVYITFLLVMLVSFLAGLSRALSPLGYTPELMSALVLVYVLLEGSRQRFVSLPAKYCFAFGGIALIAACGVAANDVGAAPLFNGMRYYLRALPFFFLPAIAGFDDAQILRQLRLLLGLAMLQFPVSVFQRWVVYSQGRFSGDNVIGTVGDSGALSIFLICAALVATGLYFRKYLRRSAFLLILCILLIPTSINETKVTAIFVPLGFLITVLLGAQKGQRVRIFGSAIVLMAIFAGLFISVYDAMEVHSPYKEEKSIVGFFSNQKQVNHYLYSKSASVGARDKDIGRLDSIIVPFDYISKDPVRLTLGLGVGNTSPSTVNRSYEGKYHELFAGFLGTSFASFLLELGLGGMSALLVLYMLIGADALAVARAPGVVGGIAVGWAGVTVLMCISLIYTDVHMDDALSYPFWYFSGLIAAQRMKLQGLSHAL